MEVTEKMYLLAKQVVEEYENKVTDDIDCNKKKDNYYTSF